jgi:hypothetical protein
MRYIVITRRYLAIKSYRNPPLTNQHDHKKCLEKDWN